MLTSIVGINWGDEGKGRMVDLLSSNYDIVVRYQGGNNAGHTVINEKGKFILNLLPSGILREEVVNVMGNGMVIDVKHLFNEIKKLRDAGIKISPENLKISDKAVICMPYNVLQDQMEEARLKDKKFGSTMRGIAPIYADKYLKKAIRMGDLKNFDRLKERLKDIVDWKNLTVVGAYNHEPVKYEDMVEYLEEYGLCFKDYIIDTSLYLDKCAKEDKKIMFEAQLGALRDIDFGIYPYTSSSSTISSYAPIGAGIPNHKLDKAIGIMKAYSTCVGEGPFTCEYFGEKAHNLREAGGEYGAATGRPRRVGPFDAIASKYGCRVQGADEIAITKLDVLTGFEELEVVVAYELDGEIVKEFPYSQDLERCKPITVTLKGWKEDISNCRTKEELPENARKYIEFIAKETECKVKYVSVGASREQYLIFD